VPIFAQLPESFELKIGTTDFTQNVTQLRWKWLEIDKDTPQKSTVEFSLVLEAFPTDLEKLNPNVNQNLCRQAHECTLKVNGYLLFTGYLDRYKYNFLSKTANGTLVDAIELISYSRSEFELENIEVGAGTSVGAACKQLLDKAATPAAGGAPLLTIATPNLTGFFTAPLTSGSPVEDAQHYAGADTTWLYATPSGALAWQKYSKDRLPIFRRSLAECLTFEQDPFAEAFQSTQLTVRGSHEAAKPTAAQSSGFNGNSITTASYAPLIAIDPEAIDNSTQLFPFNLTVSERKTIFRNNPGGDAEYVRTTIERPHAAIDPNFSSTATQNLPFALTVAEEIEERRTKKIVRKPSISIDTNALSDSTKVFPFRLTTLSEETVDNELGFSNYDSYNNPPRDNNPVPEFEVETVPVAGTVSIIPECTTPLLKRGVVRDVGYLYDTAQAQRLAGWILEFQQARYEGVLVELPPPLEWLADPKPFQVCDLHDGRFVIEAPELVIDGGSKTCRLIFRGLRVGTISEIPPPPEIVPFLPTATGLAVAPLPNFNFTVGYQIPPVANRAAGGTLPYSWSAVLPPGLSIDPATGAIAGVPTAVGTTNASVTVTDATAAIASVNFAIVVQSLPAGRPNTRVEVGWLAKRVLKLSLEIEPVRGEELLAGRVFKNSVTPGVVVAPPPNDDFANAQFFALANPPNSTQVNLLGSTKQAGEPNHYGANGTRSVWYFFNSSDSTSVRVTLEQAPGIATNFAVYSGTDLSSLTLVAESDSEVTFSTPGTSQTYYLAVSCGQKDLAWTGDSSNLNRTLTIAGLGGGGS
jgi:hypothetical protein